MTSKKWYSRNNTLLSLLLRTFIIIIYVVQFDNPSLGGIIIVIAQTAYSIYFIIFLRFTKLRYFVGNLMGNFILVGIYMTSYIASVNDLGTDVWNNCSTAYIVILMILVILFFILSLMEIIVQRQKIVKQLKSFYRRFIQCDNDDQI